MLFKKLVTTALLLFTFLSPAYAKPWLTPEEQIELKALVDRNEAVDLVGNGIPGDPNQWGKQWWLQLVFQRTSTGVSYRDPTHGIVETIGINQSLPYRILNYKGEESIPFGVPEFPKVKGKIPFYFPKSDRVLGSYADLMFLGPNGYIVNSHGVNTDSSFTQGYAKNNGMTTSQVYNDARVMQMYNLYNGSNRALSRREIFPLSPF